MGRSTASVCAVFVLLACQTDKPENQVRKAFEACRRGVEARDAAAASAPLDPMFQGPEGLDRAAAKLFLRVTLEREKVGVTILRNEVTVRGSEALQEVDLLLSGRSGGLLPQDASRRGFRLRWRKVGGDWKLLELQSLDGR